jgi:hypothetical protein
MNIPSPCKSAGAAGAAGAGGTGATGDASAAGDADARAGLEAALRTDAILADWERVLRRTLRGLSTTELTALGAGLERHRGRLVAGRLFSPRQGGGCAVGVMLLELDALPQGRLAFWARHAWRSSATSYGAARSHPRLRHLEWTFDSTVDRLRDPMGWSRREAVDAVGSWFELETERELAWRGLAAMPAGPASRGDGDTTRGEETGGHRQLRA